TPAWGPPRPFPPGVAGGLTRPPPARRATRGGAGGPPNRRPPNQVDIAGRPWQSGPRNEPVAGPPTYVAASAFPRSPDLLRLRRQEVFYFQARIRAMRGATCHHSRRRPSGWPATSTGPSFPPMCPTSPTRG